MQTWVFTYKPCTMYILQSEDNLLYCAMATQTSTWGYRQIESLPFYAHPAVFINYEIVMGGFQIFSNGIGDYKVKVNLVIGLSD